MEVDQEVLLVEVHNNIGIESETETAEDISDRELLELLQADEDFEEEQIDFDIETEEMMLGWEPVTDQGEIEEIPDFYLCDGYKCWFIGSCVTCNDVNYEVAIGL